jgi:hypothetical protein
MAAGSRSGSHRLLHACFRLSSLVTTEILAQKRGFFGLAVRRKRRIQKWFRISWMAST